VGATFTADVHAYEMMKIRVLNAGHQVLANAGELLSVPTIADCMAHRGISAMFRKVEVEEILPHVEPVPGMSPADYLALVERRFSNPAIRDTTRRVAFDGSSRHTGFLLPVIREALSVGGKVDGLALVEALWARMCAGRREDGTRIEPNDPNWTDLTAVAEIARERPRAWLEQEGLYGGLAAAAPFADAFERWLSLIWRDGTAEALAAYAGGR
jgi:mannitol 2-dehydrogenase